MHHRYKYTIDLKLKNYKEKLQTKQQQQQQKFDVLLFFLLV